MNIGAMLVLIKLFQDAGPSGPVGPPAPNDKEIPTNVSIKPLCGPGRYAQFNFTTGLWSCLVIPKGR
jgi:hypothetical protein